MVGASVALAAADDFDSGDLDVSAEDVSEMYSFVEQISVIMYSERKFAQAAAEIFN